jgi:hypothetical protein
MRIHEPDGHAQERKVVLNQVRGQVGGDGVGKQGRDEEHEGECGKRPERPIRGPAWV